MENISKHESKTLFDRMMKSEGSQMSKDEWEAIGLYSAFVFRKPQTPLTDSLYDQINTHLRLKTMTKSIFVL